MSKSIALKFFTVLLAILLFAFLVFYLWLDNLVKNSQIEQSKNVIATDIQTHARQFLEPQLFIFDNAQSSRSRFVKFMNDIRTSEIVRIKIWDLESRVIFSDDESIIGKIFPEDEALKASLGGLVKAAIQKPTTQENAGESGYGELLEEYIPVYFGTSSRPVGSIEIYYTLHDLNTLLLKIRRFIFVASVLVIASIISAAWLLFRILVRGRLALLVNAAHEVAGGNLDLQVPVVGRDEIGELTGAFNFMTSKLKESYEGLERKVLDRTAELEKDNKLMIGRELKMIELKKELEELKNVIEKNNGKNQAS